MSRTTYHDVNEILETSLTEAELIAFVEDAHRIIENRCASYSTDDDALASAETYLAAHLATTKDPRVKSASHAGADIEYDTNGNRYWHQAVLLDPSNRLARPSGYSIKTT